MEKKLVLNTSASLLNQIITAICGLILPRLILSNYGSETYGLLSSITQFLGLIAFVDLGVGAVTQSALYKPLAKKDDYELSKIMISSSKYYKNIAKIFIIYICLLIIFYPLLLNKSFDFVFTSSLILIISISSFFEYYFGIANQQLLNADQKSYVYLNIKNITQVLNTIFCVIIIKFGLSIHFVKLITSIIFLIRPLYLYYYVNKNYNINYDITLIEEPIKQKWNGLAQHITAVVNDKTDIIILTLFSSLRNVSIYSVYYLVVNNLHSLVVSSTIGVQSILGNLYAINEKEKLRNFFDKVEIINHFFITMLFCVCGIMVIPFVRIYTQNINDANYINVPFAIILTLAYAVYCLRNLYYIMIKAAGHYKETQKSAIIEMLINIIISSVTVLKFGLIGVAIGTLISMIYRTVYLVNYLSRKILNRNVEKFYKNLFVDFLIILIMVILNNFILINPHSYFKFFIILFFEIILNFIISFVINLIFYNKILLKIINNLKIKLKLKRKKVK